jgi:hypothetical protein
MKQLSILALILAFGGASIYAEQAQVRMTFSGTTEHGPVVVQPGLGTDDQTIAGNSSLGDFTYHELLVQIIPPSGTCAGLVNFQITTGGGVFKFADGSLLITKLTEGSICVIPGSIPGSIQGTVTETCQITGGTGRFNNASGTLKFTATWNPVLFDSSMTPVLFAVSGGQVTGTITLQEDSH